jgi:hypothetical protein
LKFFARQEQNVFELRVCCFAVFQLGSVPLGSAPATPSEWILRDFCNFRSFYFLCCWSSGTIIC